MRADLVNPVHPVKKRRSLLYLVVALKKDMAGVSGTPSMNQLIGWGHQDESEQD